MFLSGIKNLRVFLIKNRNLIMELAKKEFKAKYLGSYLGAFWGIIQPLVTILIFWFLFESGFRKKPVSFDFPFILWLMSGFIPWFFINEVIATNASSILENSFLIKKVAFPVSVIPLVKVLAVLFVHLFFILFLLLVFFIYGYPLTLYSLQIFYYLAASIILVTGISLITASVTVFIKDVRHFVAIIMQFSFWMSAVFWPIKILPHKYQYLIRLNPFSYIIEGYRNSLIFHQWFWQNHLHQTIYFWCFTLLVFLMGIFLYKKLRPFFADYI